MMLELRAMARWSAFAGAVVLVLAADPAGCDVPEDGAPMDRIPTCRISALAPDEDDGRIVGEVVVRCNERVKQINGVTITLERKAGGWQAVNSARRNVPMDKATGLGGWPGQVSAPCATGEYRTTGQVRFRSRGETRTSTDNSRSVTDPCE